MIVNTFYDTFSNRFFIYFTFYYCAIVTFFLPVIEIEIFVKQPLLSLLLRVTDADWPLHDANLGEQQRTNKQ